MSRNDKWYVAIVVLLDDFSNDLFLVVTAQARDEADAICGVNGEDVKA